MRILLAEDETIIRLDLRGIIERAGFEVCAEAKDGEEAVELARSQQPDLAILDVKMPRLDGIEAARRIIDERPIPIVMLTAYSQDDLVARAVEAGVFGYLVKPFREADLLPAIQAASARHDELATLREEADSLAEALATRKLVERAKGLLMDKEGLTEQEAFARLRRASQISGPPDAGRRRGADRDLRSDGRVMDPERRALLVGRTVEALRGLIEELEITNDEWYAALEFLTEVGARDEFILLSDVNGLSVLVDDVTHGSEEAGGTPSNVLGPFYFPDAPLLDSPARICRPDEPGEPLVLRGVVRGTGGEPLPAPSSTRGRRLRIACTRTRIPTSRR